MSTVREYTEIQERELLEEYRKESLLMRDRIELLTKVRTEQAERIDELVEQIDLLMFDAACVIDRDEVEAATMAQAPRPGRPGGTGHR